MLLIEYTLLHCILVFLAGMMRLVLAFTAKKELSAIRDMYFQNKDKIFGRIWKMYKVYTISQNTAEMKELAKECFKDLRMNSVDHPKYDTCCLSY